MTWFRCDDQLADHPKVMALGALRRPALGLWTMCGTYSARHLTDGFVSRSVAMRYAESGRELRRLTDALVASGLFDEVEAGWSMHDYLDWNPSREQVMGRRVLAKEAGRQGGLAKGKAGAKRDAKPNARSPLEPPDYSRPVPNPSRSNERDAREPDAIEIGVRHLLNGGGTDRQIETMQGLAEQIGDESAVLSVLGEWRDQPVRNRYGGALNELRDRAERRKHSRASRAVQPTTNYDRLMESDDDEQASA